MLTPTMIVVREGDATVRAIVQVQRHRMRCRVGAVVMSYLADWSMRLDGTADTYAR